ncbi:HPr family phosphocarrier protein [Streptomyces capparidis]
MREWGRAGPGVPPRPPGPDNPAFSVKGYTMVERRVTVGWAEGLHARPASLFVRAATAAGVPVTIAKAGGTPVNAASMLGVLGLGAQGGEEVVLASEADGAEAALDRLAKLVAEGLDELPETV